MTIELGFPEISDLLSARMEDLVDALQLRGTRQGHVITPLNPTRGDTSEGSFVIQIGGNREGRWNDYAADHRGDALDLVAYIAFGGWPIGKPAKREALRWAKRWLGISDASDKMVGGTEKLVAARQAAERRRAQAEGQAKASLGQLRGRAFSMWTQARKLAPDTPAWRYLVDARGIPLQDLAHLPSAVRWVPDARYTVGDDKPPLIMPALYTAMWLPDGSFAALHRTFLAEDGSGKAAVASPKKIWPRGFWGSFIPLARGKTGVGIAEATRHGLVDEQCWCEGIEDGLSIAALAPEWRVHAVGVAGNFAEQDIPATAASGVVARDNDPDPKARQAVGRAIDKLRERCRAAEITLFETRAKGGKDFNDMIRAG